MDLHSCSRTDPPHQGLVSVHPCFTFNFALTDPCKYILSKEEKGGGTWSEILQRAWKSSSGISQPKTWIFSLILSGWLDLGTTLVPLWSAHFTRTWPGVLFILFEIVSTVLSCMRSLPDDPKGEYAWKHIYSLQNYPTFLTEGIIIESSLKSYSDMDVILLTSLQHFIIPPSWMHLHLKPRWWQSNPSYSKVKYYKKIGINTETILSDLTHWRHCLSKTHNLVELLNCEIAYTNISNYIFLDKLLHFSPNSFHVKVQHLSWLGRPAGSIFEMKRPMDLQTESLIHYLIWNN